MDIITVQIDGAPLWAKTVAIDDDNNLFIAHNWSGRSLDEVFLCASFDGAEYYRDREIYYFPINWMRAEFPSSKEACDKIENHVKQFLLKNPGAKNAN